MKLILAQGNPVPQYDGTRHNAGFFMLDRFAAAHGASWNEKAKFNALVAELAIGDEKVLLAKPTTYYNETGRAARALTDFYKLTPASDILVVHDELALPFGTVRTRSGGSDAGNNGIKSLNATLGQGYKRIRVGIFNDLPGLGKHQIDEAGFVTGRFSADEHALLPQLYDIVGAQIEAFIAGAHVDKTVTL